MVTWRVVINLEDYGTGWESADFKLGAKVKASGTSYIYGNATGQYIFKLTELNEWDSVNGTPGCYTYNIP